MERTDDVSGLLSETGPNAVAAWLVVGVLALTGVRTALEGAFDWTFITLSVVAVALVPAGAFRDPRVMPPWELIVIVAIPILWQALLGWGFLTDVLTYLAIAALALLIAVELHQFTTVRMNHTFAIVLVVLTTLAVAGVWNVLQWLADVFFGTEFLLDGRSQDAINADVMLEFIYAGIAGVGGGLLFDLYFRSRDRTPTERTYVPPLPRGEQRQTADRPESPKLRDRIGIPPRRQRQASRAMQIVLAVVLLWGLYVQDLPTIANAAVALVITFVPAILEREYDLPMDAGLVLWITTAVFLHALGSAGLYDAIDPWDHLTHALSASVVAAAGYAIFRAIHVHTDRIYIPSKLMAVFILLFVFAAGVVWEILEFIVDQSAIVLGLDAVLAQYGIDDTIVDLIFNTVGAVIVTLWGTAYLTDISDSLSERFDKWADSSAERN
ncbi:hypothetical protein [Natronobacterium gregoryi]|uniref:Uncharacterized protein n=2 Tax=Natronobacterium gregoryi TaxID=44930 RepID=L0ADG4_NATGS|nr:hypothetical protein [Natronobacterium gregoryi]AFZ71953.1 hypothetical protein Natgr_0707 [Natronobacterium gregoryi SP2]ELY62550.1 hypothetical protein C490_17721 [Natronobacterium gregoryi SP2]PLK20730.1 hypothetical protein CYV19_08245 [Natronobacterium gregoryi SP2]SFJ12941.1 hypothetical protein SAMN05443661_11514 [Natronobacterium gregoryi]